MAKNNIIFGCVTIFKNLNLTLKFQDKILKIFW